ncbi:ATP-binding cassette domain-containing protein [Micromonospora sp. CPCC 205371]|nr:ATP-binding cassette domain-containing protein [Micromonospora sp. CPCC 205371]
MLRIDRLNAGYGGGSVLHDVDLSAGEGRVQAIVGRNGAGKTTLVHAIAGLLRPYSGAIEVSGVDLAGQPAHRIARAGVGLVPQGRRVFASLTVAEHLRLATSQRDNPIWTVGRVLDLLPRLAQRLGHRGDQLSGGEQQMLALARALLTQPRLLLLDEPCEGLAGEVAGRVREVVAGLAAGGMTVLIVEQQLHHAIRLADRIAVLDYGRLIADEPADGVRADPAPIEALLSIAQRR